MRNQMAMAPQILAQGQQRLQGVPAQFEPRFMERLVLFFPSCSSSTSVSFSGGNKDMLSLLRRMDLFHQHKLILSGLDH